MERRAASFLLSTLHPQLVGQARIARKRQLERWPLTLPSLSRPVYRQKMSSPLALLAMGNPLLDMQVVDKPELLEKYSLKPNDAVLAEGKQSEMCVRFCLHVSERLLLTGFLRCERQLRRLAEELRRPLRRRWCRSELRPCRSGALYLRSRVPPSV